MAATVVAGFTTLGEAAFSVLGNLGHSSGQLVVFAGQSNALGFQVSPADLPEGYSPDPHVLIWTATGFEIMQAGVNTGTPANPFAWGPEVQFASDFRHEHPDETLYIVKSVKGSTGLAHDPTALDWSPRSLGELFDQTTSAVAAASKASGLTVSGIFWMQGEEDATSAAKAMAYGANLQDLIAQMRLHWGDPLTEVVIGKVSDESGLPYAGLIRAGEDHATDGTINVSVVETDDLPRQDDHLHLTGAGELGLGDRFYGAYTPPEDMILTRDEPWWAPGHDNSIWPSGWVLSAAAVFALVCSAFEVAQGVA